MSDEPVSLSFEQQAWVTVSLEIETELLQGYTGDIVLHCLDGVVQSYHLNEKRVPGKERRTHERRTAGPRDGEDRRRKS